MSHPLHYELRCLLLAHKDGSYSTQYSRRQILTHLGDQLAAKFPQLHAPDLKGRHTTYLLGLWQTEGLSVGTVKNRLAVLRWWCKHIGNPGLLRQGNAAYGVGARSYVATVNKAHTLEPDRLAQVKSAHVRMSLRFQEQFGLRREESLLIRPWLADKGDVLAMLGATWCKGGRVRDIPMDTDAQRQCLEAAKQLVRFQQASLIPKGTSLKRQLSRFVHECRLAGIHHVHGLRHRWAQQRFELLAGFPCPLAGGPRRAELTSQQWAADQDARQWLAESLGHDRERITAMYLGR